MHVNPVGISVHRHAQKVRSRLVVVILFQIMRRIFHAEPFPRDFGYGHVIPDFVPRVCHVYALRFVVRPGIGQNFIPRLFFGHQGDKAGARFIVRLFGEKNRRAAFRHRKRTGKRNGF